MYLLDFGLACRFKSDCNADPKKMHNGTIEYTSRDAHQGITSMRGDVEILGYNLIEWAGAKLPWVVKKLLAKPEDVQKSKEEFMKSTDKSLKSSFGSAAVPTQFKAFFKYLETITVDAKPDYNKIRGFFEAGMKELGAKNAGKLDFSPAKVTPKSPAAAKKKEKSTPGLFKSVFEDEAGPSTRKAERKRYMLDNSESDEEEVAPKVKAAPKPRKVLTSKASMPVKKVKKVVKPVPALPALVDDPEPINVPEPVETEKESRATKRVRAPKNYAEEQPEDQAPPLAKSPQKKSRVQASPTTRSTSKENHERSPPQKKSKEDDPKKEKSSKRDDKNGAAGSITLKSKSNSSKNKKTIQLNFNLDVSLDSDLVVVVNRKDKKKKAEEPREEAATSDDGTPNRAGVYKGKHAKAN